MQQPVSVQARGSSVTWRCMPPFPPAGHFRLGVIVFLQTVGGGWDVWRHEHGKGGTSHVDASSSLTSHVTFLTVSISLTPEMH